jgi:hypothetical protein
MAIEPEQLAVFGLAQRRRINVCIEQQKDLASDENP